MIHTEKAVRILQAVAMTVGLAVFLWSTGLPALFHMAEAASITNASDTLTNSAPSSVSNHTFVFTLPNGALASSTIELTFDANFTTIGGNIIEDDVDVDVNGTASSTAAVNAAGTFGVSITGNVIRLTTATDAGLASSTELTVRIGTNATDSGTGVNQITNPSATSSYPIDIDGGASASPIQDSGQVRVAIIEEVTVSASVNTTLEFSVSGVDAGSTVNSSPTTTVATTTATTLPFGTLTQDQSETLAHDLAVTTNATNGYSVTVSLSGALQSSTGAIIDSFIDGADTSVPAAWTSPSANIADDKTFGHWGITSDDASAQRASEFGADQWAGIATSTPTIVMGHTGPADGSTAGIGTARIGYQIEISPLQEAGDDYNTTLRYIATPTF
jgi:hypothetical protein